MEEEPPQARRRGPALILFLLAGCFSLHALPGVGFVVPDHYFLRYDVYSRALSEGEARSAPRPEGDLLKKGRTLFVQAGREAVVNWRGRELRFVPAFLPSGGLSIELAGGRRIELARGGAFLLGLGDASAFVAVEAAE